MQYMVLAKRNLNFFPIGSIVKIEMVGGSIKEWKVEQHNVGPLNTVLISRAKE